MGIEWLAPISIALGLGTCNFVLLLSVFRRLKKLEEFALKASQAFVELLGVPQQKSKK